MPKHLSVSLTYYEIQAVLCCLTALTMAPHLPDHMQDPRLKRALLNAERKFFALYEQTQEETPTP